MAFVSGSSGVDVLHVFELPVVFDVDDVRVAADQNVGLGFVEQLFDSRWIAAGAASNMSHQNVDAFTLESKVLRILIPNRSIVDVSVNSFERQELCELLSNFQRSEITCVPDLIAIFEGGEDFWVKEAVGVRDESDLHVS